MFFSLNRAIWWMTAPTWCLELTLCWKQTSRAYCIHTATWFVLFYARRSCVGPLQSHCWDRAISFMRYAVSAHGVYYIDLQRMNLLCAPVVRRHRRRTVHCSASIVASWRPFECSLQLINVQLWHATWPWVLSHGHRAVDSSVYWEEWDSKWTRWWRMADDEQQ